MAGNPTDEINLFFFSCARLNSSIEWQLDKRLIKWRKGSRVIFPDSVILLPKDTSDVGNFKFCTFTLRNYRA